MTKFAIIGKNVTMPSRSTALLGDADETPVWALMNMNAVKLSAAEHKGVKTSAIKTSGICAFLVSLALFSEISPMIFCL